MSKIKYIDRRFSTSSRVLIDQAGPIIESYEAQGFKLTLRQLYYQFVARGFLPNTVLNYKRLGSVMNDARLAGLIDWDSIEDRTRSVSSIAHWADPAEIVETCAQQFRIDKWADQAVRPEVWIEKEALAGVVEGICKKLDISYLSCRGYTSQSEMHSSALRMRHTIRCGQTPMILHFGDHDPSGIDMTRDITDRLEMFMGGIDLHRMALNMDQIDHYNPPPNPAKTTDSRYDAYQQKYGVESWELDALEPAVIAKLIEDRVLDHRDEDKWEAKVEEEVEHRRLLGVVSSKWDKITAKL